jgi:hypothetical protein
MSLSIFKKKEGDKNWQSKMPTQAKQEFAEGQGGPPLLFDPRSVELSNGTLKSKNITLHPDRSQNVAKVAGSGWGYHGTVVGSKLMTFDDEKMHFWEVKLQTKAYGSMVGVVDPRYYNTNDGAACNTQHGWVFYCNNGRLIHNKECVGETGERLRAGDTLGILYELKPAEKPKGWVESMGELKGACCRAATAAAACSSCSPSSSRC